MPPTSTASLPASEAVDTISGLVVDQNDRPVERATVRIQATGNLTSSNKQGRFSLCGLKPGKIVTVSAWKDLYYCAKRELPVPRNGKTTRERTQAHLAAVPDERHPNYSWVPPTGENSCYSCKPGVTQVWLENDAHSKSAVNPRFLTMYNGTDINGNRSPLTRFI